MCLIVDEQKTVNLMYDKPLLMTVYKILEQDPDTLELKTPMQKTDVKLRTWLHAEGELKVQNTYNNLTILTQGVIHAYTNKKTAISECFYHADEIVVECKAWFSDLVVVGHCDEICFKKIYITSKIFKEWKETARTNPELTITMVMNKKRCTKEHAKYIVLNYLRHTMTSVLQHELESQKDQKNV